jgi:hypothetical protein
MLLFRLPARHIKVDPNQEQAWPNLPSPFRARNYCRTAPHFTAKHRESKEEKSPPLTATLEFDEQIRFLNDESQEPFAGLPYYIECKGKKIASGRTDENGMCLRVSTQTRSESLAYYIGDEALAKADF